MWRRPKEKIILTEEAARILSLKKTTLLSALCEAEISGRNADPVKSPNFKAIAERYFYSNNQAEEVFKQMIDALCKQNKKNSGAR
jgi:hypothetical protein